MGKEKLFLLVLLFSNAACAHKERPFSTKPIVWADPDKMPIAQPKSYWSGLYWDIFDKLTFRPLSRMWLFGTFGPAKNVNALGEIPNSSWYTNRMAIQVLSPERVARGPCSGQGISSQGPWRVFSGKTDGKNPGFVVEDETDGRRYLLKFDDPKAPTRATTADVIGSKIYWAAGFSTPCNEIVYFDPKIIRLTEKSTKTDHLGRKTTMTQADIKRALKTAAHSPEGKTRGSASLFLPGVPLGPFTYDGTRPDDPNDTIRHENRRELRGSRLLAAWLNHYDAREQNTFSTFVKREGKDVGYVQHHVIDFGDCLGAQSFWDLISRRAGHSYYLDFGHVVTDLIAFGIIIRPWDRATIHKEAPLYGYYDIENFEPEAWKPAYPNPAFNHVADGDAFWATKVISRFSNAHIEALVNTAQIPNPAHKRYLSKVLSGRRDKIVRHYFTRLSALDFPRTEGATACVSDLMVQGGYALNARSFYKRRIQKGPWSAPFQNDTSEICIDVPQPAGEPYVILELKTRRDGDKGYAKPVAFHLAAVDEQGYQVVGIER